METGISVTETRSPCRQGSGNGPREPQRSSVVERNRNGNRTMLVLSSNEIIVHSGFVGGFPRSRMYSSILYRQQT